MPNYVHLLVFTPAGNLSRGMQWLHGTYAPWFNRRHRLAGHIFDGRFRSKRVEDEQYRLAFRTTLGFFGVKPEVARRRYERFVLDAPPKPP